MRIAICVLGALAAVSAAFAAPATAAPGGIEGEVVNTTCYGPCMDPPPRPPLYTGSGLVVTIRRLATGERVARLRPTDGRFAIRVRRGRYLVEARVEDGAPSRAAALAYSCWEGSRREVRVHRHEVSTARLTVANVCIV